MNEKFKERLKELLEREGLTQKDLAEDVGITEAALSRYMKGNRIPNGENLCNMATALRTTTDYLLGRVDVEEFNKQIDYDDMEGLLARNAKDYTIEQRERLLKIILKN
ncbi:MAG: helix-turn-helix transcriptional regulator [Bacilli bacterium]|nr:helix-turn-helix transcriptional regulator [Bacilli bacterium]